MPCDEKGMKVPRVRKELNLRFLALSQGSGLVSWIRNQHADQLFLKIQKLGHLPAE